MPSPSTNPLKSAIPTVYYVAFGIIEPLVAFLGFLEGISDPNKVCVSTDSEVSNVG